MHRSIRPAVVTAALAAACALSACGGGSDTTELDAPAAPDTGTATRPLMSSSQAAEHTAAKYLAAEASFETSLRAVLTHGGFGFAKEYHVERGLRESVLSLLAPVAQELALCYVAEQALGLPKSY